jgi:hypothetical protein
MARAVAIAFGATYGLVAVIGLIDGDDVLGLIPINSADNALHVGLALLGLVLGLISRNAPRDQSTAAIDGKGGRSFRSVQADDPAGGESRAKAGLAGEGARDDSRR